MVARIWRKGQDWDFDSEIAVLDQADGADRIGLALRYSAVCLSGAAIWLGTGRSEFMVWAVIYVLIGVAYNFSLRRVTAPVELPVFLKVFILKQIWGLWFIAGVLYIASVGGLFASFVASSGAIGLALHALLANHRWNLVATADAILVGIASFGVTIAIAAQVEWPGPGLALLAVYGAVIVYFGYGYLDVLKMRERLSQRRSAEVQADKMAAIGQLSAGIAHDFNNLLTVIRGNLDLIDEVDDPAERRVFMDEARQSTDRAAYLVRQLLAFSRKAPISPELVSLPKLLEDCGSVLRRLLPENIHLVVEESKMSLSLFVDPNLLHTALLNAALNARDAMMPEGGELTIVAQCENEEVFLRVLDRGPGVPSNILHKLAEPFFSTKPVGAGSGLGLSMIKGFAEQSGGRLELANRPRGGFAVSIVLPEVADPTGLLT